MKLNNEKGAALVELALSVSLLATILFGIIEFGRVMYMRNSLNLAAREGARMASVSNPLPDSGTVQSYLVSKGFLPSSWTTASAALTTIPYTDPSGRTTSIVQVQVSMPFQSVVPLLVSQLNGLTLTGQASMLYEY